MFNRQKPKPNQLTPFELHKEYSAKLDSLIADALAARVDLREFARTAGRWRRKGNRAWDGRHRAHNLSEANGPLI